MTSYKITQSGQGLIEVIVAIAIIVTGISGAVTLTYSNLRSNESSITQIIGANLAREGVEIVRNLRDENWLLGSNWLNSIKPNPPVSSNPGVFLFATTTNIWTIKFTTLLINDGRLFLDNDGIYNSEGRGTLTPYQRTVEVYDILCQQDSRPDVVPVPPANCPIGYTSVGIKVKVQVQWQENGGTKVYALEENLYNWHDAN